MALQKDYTAHMDQAASIRDAIEETLELWGKTLPGTDMAPLGVVLRITRLNFAFAEDLQKFLRPFGIGSGDMDVLFCLLNKGPPYALRPSDISKGCYVTTGATTGRVDRLINAGLVERGASSKDRREMLVRLTPEGKKLAQKLKREVAIAVDVAGILADMGPHDRAEFIRLLRSFHQRLQQSRQGGNLDAAVPFATWL